MNLSEINQLELGIQVAQFRPFCIPPLEAKRIGSHYVVWCDRTPIYMYDFNDGRGYFAKDGGAPWIKRYAYCTDLVESNVLEGLLRCELIWDENHVENHT